MQYADSSSGRGSPASRIEPSVAGEVLAPSPRLALREWTTSKAPRFSCLFTLLRGSCYKMGTTFGDALTGHPRGCKIKGYLRQSSLLTPLREASLMPWRCCVVTWGFSSWSSLFGDYAPEPTTEGEKSLATIYILGGPQSLNFGIRYYNTSLKTQINKRIYILQSMNVLLILDISILLILHR